MRLMRKQLIVLAEAKAIHEEDISACRKIGEHLISLLEDDMGVLTHIVMRGLATSAYGTALSPFCGKRKRLEILR